MNYNPEWHDEWVAMTEAEQNKVCAEVLGCTPIQLGFDHDPKWGCYCRDERNSDEHGDSWKVWSPNDQAYIHYIKPYSTDATCALEVVEAVGMMKYHPQITEFGMRVVVYEDDEDVLFITPWFRGVITAIFANCLAFAAWVYVKMKENPEKGE